MIADINATVGLHQIILIWNKAKTRNQLKIQRDINNHLLIIVDACYFGKWAHDLEFDPRLKHIKDISIQTSSKKNQTSSDGRNKNGGYFMNNFLYLNGMKDLVYIHDHKGTDKITTTKKRHSNANIFLKIS